MKRLALLFFVIVCALSTVETRAGGHGNRVAARFSRVTPWHAPYYNTQYGAPVNLVVPPRASMQTTMQWGVSGTEMVPIYHQFARPYPGEAEPGSTMLSPTPRWPSHTDQFGVYYIRGPW